ncbi:MAG: hypothetical protein ACK5HA_08600 [Planctomycetaceae bacterium]
MLAHDKFDIELHVGRADRHFEAQFAVGAASGPQKQIAHRNDLV